MIDLDTQYLKWIRTVLDYGEEVQTRNAKCLQYFSPPQLEVENVSEQFPMLCYKPFPVYRSVLETCFFLQGRSDFKDMPEVLRNSWWKPWAAEAEDNGSWGNFYSTQWRNQDSRSGKKYDQLKHLLEELRRPETSRRAIVTLWRAQDFDPSYTANPAVLPCCHSTVLQFNRVGDQLDLHHYQRSLDLMCGTNADLIYSGLLMHFIANAIGAKPRRLVYSVGNMHIYEPHLKEVRKLALDLSNCTHIDFPTLKLLKSVDFDNLPTTIEEAKELVEIKFQPFLSQQYKFKLIK